jgi:hypothetical protein
MTKITEIELVAQLNQKNVNSKSTQIAKDKVWNMI